MDGKAPGRKAEKGRRTRGGHKLPVEIQITKSLDKNFTMGVRRTVNVSTVWYARCESDKYIYQKMYKHEATKYFNGK